MGRAKRNPSLPLLLMGFASLYPSYRSRSLNRPILGRDGCGIGADDFGQRVATGAQQRRGEIVLDVVDQAKALVGQRRLELDQARAGAGFYELGNAGVVAAGA